MTIFTVLVCWFVGDYFFNQGVVGVVIGVGIASISALSSYYAGDKIVLTSVRAKKANLDRHRVLMNVVKEMSLASGLPTPEVYVIPDNSPNAFATGRDPEHSSIAVTEGLLQALTREELQGVIAHEMSHVQNYIVSKVLGFHLL